MDSAGVPLLYPLDSNSSPRGIAAAGYWAAAGLGQFRKLNSGADFMSPLRRGDWVLCVRSCIVRVSDSLVWLVSLVFHYWVEKRRCLCILFARFFDYR